jgi:hypothetical protein
MVPDQPETIYRHHPVSHRIAASAFWSSPPPTTGSLESQIYEFMTNVHTWYNDKMADALLDFRNATDAFGASLLDRTIIPFVTETAEPGHSTSAFPALIFGGRALGMRGGQFQDFSASSRPFNDLWATLAQAYFKTTDPFARPELASEVFLKTNVAPIPELWAPPI